jgi:hypothetical protein
MNWTNSAAGSAWAPLRAFAAMSGGRVYCLPRVIDLCYKALSKNFQEPASPIITSEVLAYGT